MSILDGCRILCGMCEREIGSEPDALDKHLKEDCPFTKAFDYAPDGLTSLLALLPERTQ